jgi:hypothetical protein
LPNLFKVEVRLAGTWTDLTAYVQSAWRTEDITAERGLGNYVAGSITFSIVDRDTDKTARYWAQALATALIVPEVRITANDPVLPAPKIVFYGRVEPALFTYEDSVISTFTVCSLMQWAEKQNVMDALTSLAPTGRYSGSSAAIITAVLRALGCLAGTSADVVIKDYALGTTQDKADWNHTKRHWSDDDIDLDRDTVSDVYHVCQDESRNTWSFVCKHGRLYRSTLDGELTEVKDALNAAYTTTGHRLFRFVAEDDTECLAVVEVEKRRSYTHQGGQAAWSNWVSGGLAVAGAAVALLAGPLGWASWIASAALGGAAVGGMAASALGKTWRDVANGDSFYAVTGVRILSIGDGTNGAGGVGRSGATWDNTVVAPPAATRYVYVPGDAVCIQNLTGLRAAILWTVWSDTSSTATPTRTAWTYRASNGTWSWVNQGIPGMGTSECGKPVSMAVAEENYFVGASNGYLVAIPCNSHGEYAHDTRFVNSQQAAGRFVAAIAIDAGSGNWYSYFVPGNGYSCDISGKLRGAAIKTQFKWLGNLFCHNMAIPPGQPAWPTTDPEPIGLETSPALEAFLVVSAHYQPVTISTVAYLPCLYESMDADGRRLLYAGMLYAWTGGIRCRAHNDTATFSTYPLPWTGGDWRPPVTFQDVNQSSRWRFLTACAGQDGDRLTVDFCSTSLWAKAYIHGDFKRDSMSMGQLLTEAARSFWLYLRLSTLDACNSADDVRVISRHAWTPTLKGNLFADNVVKNPRVNGQEYYDGAVASSGGAKIEAGSTGVGMTVYGVSGQFLESNWARVITAEVVARYPRRSSAYPFGRRVFIPVIREVQHATGDTTLQYPPGYSDLFTSCGIWFAGNPVNGIITSVGIDRPGLTYPCQLLEYAMTDGVGDGVTWTADEPTLDAVLPTLPGLDAAVTIVAVAANKILVGWNCTHTIAAAVPATDKNFPRAWLQMVYVPAGKWLIGYAVKLTADGLETHGGLAPQLWRLSGNRPAEAIADSQAMCLSMDGYDAGLRFMPLADHGDPYTEGAPTYLPEGVYGLVAVIDRQDATDPPPADPVPATIAPPILWLDAGVDAYDRSYYLNFADIYTSGGLPIPTSLGWLDAWVAAQEHVSRYAPDIQLVLTD